MEVYGIYGTRYIVSSLGYIVHGLQSTGYMVWRVRGTWFREFGVHSFESTGTWFRRYWGTGYTVSYYPSWGGCGVPLLVLVTEVNVIVLLSAQC